MIYYYVIEEWNKEIKINVNDSMIVQKFILQDSMKMDFNDRFYSSKTILN